MNIYKSLTPSPAVLSCCWGAPVVASSSGAFVAGNSVKPLAEASAGRSNRPVLDEMQVDSYWRLDPQMNGASPAPTKNDSPESVKESVGSVKGAGKGDAKGEDVKTSPPKDAVMSPKGDDVADDVDRHVSPSETPTSAACSTPAPSTCDSSRAAKFDKYYHRNLVGIYFVCACTFSSMVRWC